MVNREADQLLYVLTAKGEISWPAYKTVLDVIFRASQAFRQDISFSRNRILRLFDSFGFCDFTFSQGAGRLLVCPSSLVRLPLQNCSAVLVGARGSTTLKQLTDAANDYPDLSVRLDATDADVFLPSRITLESANLETLLRFSGSLNIPFAPEPACWRLSLLSADIDAYASSLQWCEGAELNWKSWCFDPEHAEFRQRTDAELAIKLVRYLHPVKNIFRHRLWKNDSYAEVDVDWGRYIVLHETGFNVLFYDSRRHRFAVPRSAPMPRLLQRSLGLSSGLTPLSYSLRQDLGSRKAWDLFQLVPSQVAETVCKKLGQNLSMCSLS